MKTFIPLNAIRQYLHSILLPTIIVSFLGSNYIIFAEVGPVLKWNFSFYWLYILMLLGFGISWVYAGEINKKYLKVKSIVSKTETAEAHLQSKLKTLSRKEQEVLSLILERKNNQQICDELFISLSTLKSHINHIYKKLGVSRRQEILELYA
ncbi:LuxR family transcriptional regulator [Cyclobacteriaceae bacterium YHN15]|nr:LuxR family transcriptional regulator [Cyclobacteriaceae bacterium YHN15]